MTLNPAFRTSTVTALAARIREDRAYHLLPIIADAIQDAGCYEPWLERLRAGTPTAEAAGYLVPEGWWEYANTKTGKDRLARRAELLRLHTGATLLPLFCDVCKDRERWDRAKCPECKGPRERHNTQWYPCRTCGGSGDLLVRWANGGTMGYYADERSLSFDGPLPVVSARVEEIAEEVGCPRCGGWGRPERTRSRIGPECRRCSGTGRIVRPTAWVRNLPVWYEVTVEGVEPVQLRVRSLDDKWSYQHGDNSLPSWLWDIYYTASGNYHDSPAAARQALVAAVRRWRDSPRVDLT